MEKTNSLPALLKTKSDQLMEAVAALKSPPTSSESHEGENSSSGGFSGGGSLSRKSSKRMTAASPGHSGGSKNAHIRKSRSAQMKFDLDEVNSSADLSRASSASLGFSFSFTGFILPTDEIADSKPYSDEDISLTHVPVPGNYAQAQPMLDQTYISH